MKVSKSVRLNLNEENLKALEIYTNNPSGSDTEFRLIYGDVRLKGSDILSTLFYLKPLMLLVELVHVPL